MFGRLSVIRRQSNVLIRDRSRPRHWHYTRSHQRSPYQPWISTTASYGANDHNRGECRFVLVEGFCRDYFGSNVIEPLLVAGFGGCIGLKAIARLFILRTMRLSGDTEPRHCPFMKAYDEADTTRLCNGTSVRPL